MLNVCEKDYCSVRNRSMRRASDKIDVSIINLTIEQKHITLCILRIQWLVFAVIVEDSQGVPMFCWVMLLDVIPVDLWRLQQVFVCAFYVKMIHALGIGFCGVVTLLLVIIFRIVLYSLPGVVVYLKEIWSSGRACIVNRWVYNIGHILWFCILPIVSGQQTTTIA